jgi:hypothetical protein
MTIGKAFAVAAATLLPAAARAQPPLLPPWGVSVIVGGGVTGFLDQSTRDLARDGAAWEARVAVGTRDRVALEAAYIGSAQDLDVLGLDRDALLVGTGLEAAVRLNLVPGVIQPYLLAGVGWMRYDITRSSFNTSDISDNDSVAEFPLGVGLAYHFFPLVLDGRVTMRRVIGNDLMADGLDNLSGVLHLGVEF